MKRRWTALLIATENNHIDMACLLLDQGANIEHPTENGWTAPMVAPAPQEIDHVKNVVIEK
jgi:ankyrin repeat protein